MMSANTCPTGSSTETLLMPLIDSMSWTLSPSTFAQGHRLTRTLRRPMMVPRRGTAGEGLLALNRCAEGYRGTGAFNSWDGQALLSLSPSSPECQFCALLACVRVACALS